MKKSIMRATLPTPPGQTLVKQLDLLKKCGFDGIQLGVQGVGELPLRTPDADVTALAKACRDAGVEPHALYGGITFFREDEADRKRGLEDAHHVLEIAALIGARDILIHPGQLTSAIPYDACWKYALDGLRALKEKDFTFPADLDMTNISVTLDKDFFDAYNDETSFVSVRSTLDAPDGRSWNEWAREVYELVLSAQEAAVEAVRAGAGCAAVDAVARDLIDATGYGEHFGHGLGHGVGLEVHEEPRLTKSAEGSLEAGNLVTVEPGVYLPGELGVRIEDLVAVTEDGCEILTGFPKALTAVD